LRIKYSLIGSIVIIHLGVPPQSLAQTSPGSFQADSPRPGMQGCIPGASSEQRQRCDQNVSDQLKASSQTTVLDGGWRLVKARDPGSTSETVSAMHAADTVKSDVDLAGLSLRCAPGGLQVVLILLSSLPRADHPKVILTAGTGRNEFEASVAQTGEALLLPMAAAGLAAGDWQRASELSIEIETKSNHIRGIVPIGGLSAALRSLSPHCAVK
jgi:hypothetical protein